MPLYAEKGFRVIAIDAVGFGYSSKPNPNEFTYNQAARDRQVVSLIEVLGLENVHLIGNSMGGFTTIGTTLAIPEKIHKIVLMGTGKPASGGSGMKSLREYKISRENMYNIVRNLTNPGYEVPEEMVSYRLKLTEQPDIMDAYEATMQGIMEYELDMEAVATIQQKTLCVHGFKDIMVPIENSFELAKTIPNARLYIIPNCGHWAMLEYPEEFARVTTEFFRNQ